MRKRDLWFPFDLEPSLWWLTSISAGIALWATPMNPVLHWIIGILAWGSFFVFLGLSVAWEHFRYRWPFMPEDLGLQWKIADGLLRGPSVEKHQVEQWAKDTLLIVQKRWGMSSRNDLHFQDHIAHPSGIPILNLENLMNQLKSYGVPKWRK